MEFKYGNYENLYAVNGELFTGEGLDTFKINKNKIEYLYVEAPKLAVSDKLYLVKGKYTINGRYTSEVELIKYEGYGRYTSLGNIDDDTLKAFVNINYL